MSVKRTKTTDGLFTSERVTFDLTRPMDEATWAEFCRVADRGSIMGRIAQYEAYIAAHGKPRPAVALRLGEMRAALAIARRGGPRDAVLMAMQSAELWRREIEALPFAQRGVAFSRGRRPGAVSDVTRYLRGERRPGESARRLWERLKALGASDEQPVYFDADEMIDAKTTRTISYEAFEKRLIQRKRD